MTGALVSGQARVAVYFEGSRVWCLRPQTAPEPISQGLLPYLFGDMAAAEPHAGATLASTAELLDRACREERALHLTLISLDPSSSDTTRELAEDALEEFLEYPHVSEFIENRLFSNSLPEDASWRDTFATELHPRVVRIKHSVLAAQPAIRCVRAAWQALPVELFEAEEDKAAFDSVLTDTGAFRLLATAIADTAKPHAKGDAQVRLLSDRRYHVFNNWRKILLAWTKATPGPSQAASPKIRRQRDDEVDSRRGRSSKASPHETLQNVIRQKKAILEQLGKQNFRLAERFVDELIPQLSNQNPDLAAKSLYDLAKGAKDLGLTRYELEWSARASCLAPRYADVKRGRRAARTICA
jgi:hypothetical protein